MFKIRQLVAEKLHNTTGVF